MQIIFKRNEIANAIAPLMCATTGRSALSTSDGILIEAKKPDICTFTTYDMEKGLKITVEAKVIEEGSYIINAQKFKQTLSVMEGDEITLTVDDKLSACISRGKSNYKMNALNGADFPALPTLTSELGFEISQAVLKKMMRKTMYAMGINDQRQVLNGCFVGIKGNDIRMVACDSFKLAKCEIETELANRNSDGAELRFAFIIPTKTVTELFKLLLDEEDAVSRIYMMRKHIVIEIGDITFFSRLIEGEYIDYDRIILTTHKITVEIDKEDLVAALERAALVTEEKVAGSVRSHVKLDFSDGTLKISANSSIGSTYDELETVQQGGNICIAFNNRYLIESLRSCDSEKVKISLSSPLTSINIEPVEPDEKENDLFMLLPVRMKDQ